MDDINHAIEAATTAVNATPQDHPHYAAQLNKLGGLLGRRFKRTGLIDDIDSAIESVTKAVDATSQDEPDHHTSYLNNLADLLGRRFERTGSMGDIDNAIEYASKAVDATPQDHRNLADRLNTLGELLLRRFERTSSMINIDNAIEAASKAAGMTPHDNPDWARYQRTLGNLFGRRFGRTGLMEDIDNAIRAARNAVDATPKDDPDRAGRLSDFGNWLGIQFERTGLMDNINDAIEAISDAVDATPTDHPSHPGRLSNLGTWLGMRFVRTGSMDDINRAIEVVTKAVDIIPKDHPDRVVIFNSLGTQLAARYERTGSMEDLNRAVEATSWVVDATPQDHPDRAGRLCNLGIWLGLRFERTGSMDDLDHAVDVANKAADAIPKDHPLYPIILNNLANWLGTRFKRTGLIDDLNRVIETSTKAAEVTPQDRPDYASILTNLGTWLGVRFEQTGSVGDINHAIEVARKSIKIVPQDHPHHAGQLNNLGDFLGRRFKRTGSIDDVNYAIECVNNAIEATPQDHFDRAGMLSNLGDLLSSRFERTGSTDDIDRALSSYRAGLGCPTAPPSIRIRLAQLAARILASQYNWEESSQLLQQAVNLLPTVSPRSLKHTDKQYRLVDFAGLASMAASIALNANKGVNLALELLELGRGIIAGLLMDMRGDISDLQRKHPRLAEEFVSLRDELDVPANSLTFLSSGDDVSSWESQSKKRQEIDQKFTELIERIRTQVGFERFLLPPTQDEFMVAADTGPIIIINLSSYRCDAFLIERHQIRVLELPSLTLEEVQERIQELRPSHPAPSLHKTPLLKWLWDVVTQPCLDALGFKDHISDNNWPRVWWIPTGLLSRLPLHAAGHHAEGSTNTVLDRVMSSYASSVKALIHGRRNDVGEHGEPQSNDALLVAMRDTPGLSRNRWLPNAVSEIEMLSNLCPSLQLTPITPKPLKDEILKHLLTCKIFHFAGHGESDPMEPSLSRLLLEDWTSNPLTVGDLRDHRLQDSQAFLCYLSACSTGVNRADGLADEGIHLLNAFQLAGFRHVVGTLWEVSDKYCVHVARVFYETMRVEGIADMAVCRGLHQAIRALRDMRIEEERRERNATWPKPDRNITLASSNTHNMDLVNDFWVPYVHFGV